MSTHLPFLNTDENEAKELCLNLMRADSEAEVQELLEQAGYWENSDAWRPLGDNPGNQSTVGNQQSDAVAALTEKITNSIDARLSQLCRVSGFDPADPNGPKSPQDAVAKFLNRSNRTFRGSVWELSQTERLHQAEEITVAVSGDSKRPCITVADSGEGQHPHDFPDTLCSLSSSNKDRIPFAQGRYNMGGSGALRSCGEHHLQLIVSKRSAVGNTSTSNNWGFTVVRRFNPPTGHKNIVYKYLAPIRTSERSLGDLLYFRSETLPIFPREPTSSSSSDATARESTHGTLIKLYDYKLKRKLAQSGVCARHTYSLMRQIETCLLDFALPVKIYDCRQRRKRDQYTSDVMYGLSSRLSQEHDERHSAMEEGFPVFENIDFKGQTIKLTIYAFGLGISGDQLTKKATSYTKHSDGLLFLLNGQVQGRRSRDFFRRGSALGPLSGSLTVVLDCTGLHPRERDDLFMASRDRIVDGPLSHELLKEITEALKSNQALKELRHRREQQLSAHGATKATSVSTQIVQELLQQNKALARLLIQGGCLIRPTPPKPPAPPPVLLKYPTEFRLSRTSTSKSVAAHRPKFTIRFVTDAENDYFNRLVDCGEWECSVASGQAPGNVVVPIRKARMSLHQGKATLTISPDKPTAGDSCCYMLTVTDPSRVDAFEIAFTIKYGKGDHSPNPSPPPQPQHELPNMNRVTRDQWEAHDPPFSESTAVRIYATPDNDATNRALGYTWHINMDNASLTHAMSAQSKGSAPAATVKSVFEQVMLLAGLSALTHHDQSSKNGGGKDIEGIESLPTPENLVAHTTSAIAHIAWPLANDLSPSTITAVLEEEVLEALD